MQVKNHIVFGLVAILLIGGTIVPGMAQSETEEAQSGITLNLEKSAFYLGEKITITGQVHNFEYNSINPRLNMVEISFLDSSGNTPSSTYTDDGTLCDQQNCDLAGDTEQLVEFKLMPDEIGNFELTTDLHRGLFSPDVWNIHATTYVKSDAGTEKITEFGQFEILSPEEEIVEEEQERLVFEICEVVQRSVDKELESSECSTSDSFMVGDRLIVKGKVALEDRSQSSIPKMITVSIPYPKAMILIENGNFITTNGYGELLKQRHTLTDNIFRVIPDNDGSFSVVFNLRTGIFSSGLYAVSAEYMGYKVENTVKILEENVLGLGDPEVVITTDKDEYHLGETVQISGHIKNTLVTQPINIFIESPDVSEYNCTVIECLVDNNEKKVLPETGLTQHDFTVTYELGTHESSLGIYTIRAASAVTSDTITTFFVTEESSIINVIPPDEELSVAKKMIKKFNRIPDSEITIALETMDVDSSLEPRVIQGSLFTTARGQEANVNLQVSTSDGTCVIGQDSSCMINDSTRKPGAIYEMITIGDKDYKIRYSGTDVRLEKFSILPESTGTGIDMKDWNIQVIKEDQPTRFYYKISYVNLE